MRSNFTDQGWYLVMARTGSETPKLKTEPMGTVCDIISLHAESTASLFLPDRSRFPLQQQEGLILASLHLEMCLLVQVGLAR